MGYKLGFDDETLVAVAVYTFARILIDKGICTEDEIRRIAQEEQASEELYLARTYETVKVTHRQRRRWWQVYKLLQ